MRDGGQLPIFDCPGPELFQLHSLRRRLAEEFQRKKNGFGSRNTGHRVCSVAFPQLLSIAVHRKRDVRIGR